MENSELLRATRRSVEQLAAINEIAKAMTSTLEVREVLQIIMQKLSELMQPSNWSLILEDESGGDLYFEICVGERAKTLQGLRLKPGEGIAGSVFQTGLARRVNDVRADPSFSKRFDDASAFHTQSVLAVPLKAKGRVLGVIEIVNGPQGPGFSEEDELTLSRLADYAAIAIDNARVFRKVQELTLTDEHTGLFNARHLRALLEQEVARAVRFDHPLSLIFLDLDRFKDVNDTHGHLCGSALLKAVGHLLRKCIRQVDSAFRFGGDEFAVVLIEADPLAALTVAERMRDAFRQTHFLEERGLDIRLTASFGVASCPEHARTATDLLEAADRAMYRVKATGRDEVVVAEMR